MWINVSEVRTVSIIHRPDDGGSTQLLNIGSLQHGYTALYPSRLYTSSTLLNCWAYPALKISFVIYVYIYSELTYTV
jgi:hypothetical protein